ncbi:MAG: hypothetical protein Q7T89_12600 [Anaerolineales bacterium]|nr:hypothetical protein [Anaerolineales bacterium]
MHKKFENPFDLTKSRAYLDIGFRDYVAARVLINNGLLLQGAILASTSIEKYFKAVLTLNKITSRSHLNLDLCNKFNSFDPSLYNTFNKSFLEMLIRCYKLRYIDDVPDHFSVVFIQFPLLAELDYTISKIEEKINIYQDGKKLEFGYRQMWNNKNPEFTENNYIYLGISKNSFIQDKESKVHCMRLDPNFGYPRSTIEVYYTAERQPYDGNFSRDFIISDYPTLENPNTGIELPFKARK